MLLLLLLLLRRSPYLPLHSNKGCQQLPQAFLIALGHGSSAHIEEQAAPHRRRHWLQGASWQQGCRLLSRLGATLNEKAKEDGSVHLHYRGSPCSNRLAAFLHMCFRGEYAWQLF